MVRFLKLSHATLTRIAAGAALLLAAFAIGWYGGRIQQVSAHDSASPIRITDSEYPFISPLVGINLPSSQIFPELAKAQSDVQNIVSQAIKSGKATSIGLYFRIPGNAHSFGIGADQKFDPGSLIKVPIMIAYLKESETNPRVLTQKFLYSPSANTDSLPNALPPQLPRGTYTVERLLEAMIIDSDNTAKDILLDHMNIADLNDVFDEMDINFLKDPSGTISPKTYIVFFSRLYGAGFLNRTSSNRALELLSKTTFTEGLVAGVPTSVVVAHKYGERGIYEDKMLTGAELHDCGLVYFPGTPYYLCVMTRGTEVNDLAEVIRSISSAVYNDRASFAIKK